MRSLFDVNVGTALPAKMPLPEGVVQSCFTAIINPTFDFIGIEPIEPVQGLLARWTELRSKA